MKLIQYIKQLFCKHQYHCYITIDEDIVILDNIKCCKCWKEIKSSLQLINEKCIINMIKNLT